MDARITKSRLSNFISYEWLKIAVTAVAAIIFWLIVLATAQTRPGVGGRFLFIVNQELMTGQDYTNFEETAENNGVFSYEVLDYNSTTLTSSYASFILGARFAVGEGDLLIVSDMPFYDKNKQKVTDSYFDELVGSYAGYLGDYEKYFADCEAYLDAYYGGDYETGALDEGYLEEKFRERMKKDKRFKTEAQIAVGLGEERARIESLRENYFAVQDYIADGVLSLQWAECVVEDMNGESLDRSGTYGLQIDGSRLRSMERFAYLSAYDEEGNAFKTVDTLTFVVLPWADRQYDLQWEPLGMIRCLVEQYLDA